MTTAQRGTLVAAILGSAIVFLDSTVVNLALPRIGVSLPSDVLGTLEGQTYVVSAYLATLAAFLIPGGALGDHHGRRRVFVIGLAGFGAASVLCAVAPNLEALVLARVLQGAAGALLVPGSLAILTAAFDGPARGRAIGLWAAATSAVLVLGPPIGGVLVETAGWASIFLVNVPLVTVTVLAARRWITESHGAPDRGSFDWLGGAVAGLAVAGLAFGAIRGQEQRWQDPAAFAALGVGVVAAVAFPLLMRRRRDPLVPLQLFQIRDFATVNLSTLLIYGAFYATLFFQALFLQGTLGYTPLAVALVGLPTGILLALLSARAGTIAARIGPWRFLVAGPAVMAASQLWWLRIPPTSAAWRASLAEPVSLVPPPDALLDVLPATIAFGIGMALLVAPLTTTLMSSVPLGNAGTASAINNALARIGQPLAAAAIFIIVSAAFYTTLAAAAPGVDPTSRELRAAFQPLNPPPADASPAFVAAARVASTEAFRLSALVGAILLFAGAATNAIGIRRAPHPDHDPPATPAG